MNLWGKVGVCKQKDGPEAVFDVVQDSAVCVRCPEHAAVGAVALAARWGVGMVVLVVSI